MATYRFPSIGGRKIGYTYHSDSMALWDSAYHSVAPLGPQFGEYETFGDGLTQHGREYAVTKPNFVDYCASLAAFLLSAEQTEELRGDFRWLGADRSSRARIEFALSVKYEDGARKARYFNVLERKVSSREALQYDKRWHRVRDSHDGTVEGALCVLRAGEHNEHDTPWLFETWCLREEVRRIANEKGIWSVTTSRYFLCERDQHEEPQYARCAEQAFEALMGVCESMRLRDNAARQLDCYKSNLKIGERAGEAA